MCLLESGGISSSTCAGDNVDLSPFPYSPTISLNCFRLFGLRECDSTRVSGLSSTRDANRTSSCSRLGNERRISVSTMPSVTTPTTVGPGMHNMTARGPYNNSYGLDFRSAPCPGHALSNHLQREAGDDTSRRMRTTPHQLRRASASQTEECGVDYDSDNESLPGRLEAAASTSRPWQR